MKLFGEIRRLVYFGYGWGGGGGGALLVRSSVTKVPVFYLNLALITLAARKDTGGRWQKCVSVAARTFQGIGHTFLVNTT